MDTVTTQTDEQLLVEALAYFGLARQDVERFHPRVWSVAPDGLLRIDTAEGPLQYRAGDGDTVPCSVDASHANPRWYRGCKQCWERQKHSLNVESAQVARAGLSRLDSVRRKKRIASARNGAAPGPRPWHAGSNRAR